MKHSLNFHCSQMAKGIASLWFRSKLASTRNDPFFHSLTHSLAVYLPLWCFSFHFYYYRESQTIHFIYTLTFQYQPHISLSFGSQTRDARKNPTTSFYFFAQKRVEKKRAHKKFKYYRILAIPNSEDFPVVNVPILWHCFHFQMSLWPSCCYGRRFNFN